MDKRHFTVVEKSGKEHGLYVSSTPSSAAKKAVSKLCASNKSKKVEFYLREITQGSKKKTYGLYLGEMKKLKTPIELKGRVIQYKPVAKLSDKKINVKKEGMIGGGGGPSKLPQNNHKKKSAAVQAAVQAAVPVLTYNFVNNSPRGNSAAGPGSIYNFVNNSPRGNLAAGPAPTYNFVNNSPRGNLVAGPAPNNVSGSAAVERNNIEKLPKITDELTVEEINTIVCAMIDFLIEEDILVYEPDYNPDTYNAVGKGNHPWGESNSSRLHYFRILFEDLKEIINRHLKIDARTLWESDVYYDKSGTLYNEIHSIIDKIEIIPHKRGHTNSREIADERSKIKTLISTIVKVIQKIMQCNNEANKSYDQFDYFKQFKKFNFHIEKMLLERYYDVLSVNC